MTEPIEPTQADRDAAASLMSDVGLFSNVLTAKAVQAFARHRLASAPASTAPSHPAADLVEALKRAEQWFRDYERSHRFKGTAEGNMKADTNQERADYLRAALSRYAKGGCVMFWDSITIDIIARMVGLLCDHLHRRRKLRHGHDLLRGWLHPHQARRTPLTLPHRIEAAEGADQLDKLTRGHPLDICECGEYRSDHKDGTGPRQFNRTGFDVCHANENCMKFRLSEAHIERTTHAD